jgi:hypothetical protein
MKEKQSSIKKFWFLLSLQFAGLKTALLSNMTPYILVNLYWHFRGTYCGLHFQGRRESRSIKKATRKMVAFPQRMASLDSKFFRQWIWRVPSVDMKPYSLVDIHGHFGAMYCFHLRGLRVTRARDRRTASTSLVACCLSGLFFGADKGNSTILRNVVTYSIREKKTIIYAVDFTWDLSVCTGFVWHR